MLISYSGLDICSGLISLGYQLSSVGHWPWGSLVKLMARFPTHTVGAWGRAKTRFDFEDVIPAFPTTTSSPSQAPNGGVGWRNEKANPHVETF